MCGFVGYINKEKDKTETIKKMADLIAHRGPDSEGYYCDKNIALGFRRLSIIDLKSGSQPIYNEDKTKVIIFNGEIYNFESLKEELIKEGHKFTTKTDTEVLLHGYEQWQEKLLDKLRGMFAFVIYDIKTNELFAARDFYGIKPFYYAKMDNTLIFGSEIKSFLIHPHFKKELNTKMLEYYLTFQYSVGEETFFKNVYKLMPGHYMKYKNGKLEIKKYYEINFKEDNTKTYEEWKEGIKKRLQDSIKAHKISDVEVGSFLSSGVDSSFIAASSDVDKTFTVGFNNEKYSEIEYAKDLSSKINTQNINKVITKEEYFKNLPNILYYMDEPLADPSAIALYFVTKIASENVKVSLSGEGADEIFGGYNIYQEPLTASWYYKLPYPVRFIIGKIASIFPHKRGINFLIRRGKKLEDRFVGNAFIFDNKEVSKIIKESESSIDYNYFFKNSLNEKQKSITSTVSSSVVLGANELDCKAIVVATNYGRTARRISNLKPPCPIIAAASRKEVVKSLQLHFGVLPVIAQGDTLDELTENVKKELEHTYKLSKGDKIIITGGYPFKKVTHTNFMQIDEI